MSRSVKQLCTSLVALTIAMTALVFPSSTAQAISLCGERNFCASDCPGDLTTFCNTHAPRSDCLSNANSFCTYWSFNCTFPDPPYAIHCEYY